MIEKALRLIEENLSSWEESIKDPEAHQEKVLESLLLDYARTGYGQKFGAASISTLEEYREGFPAASYMDLRPWIEKVRQGDHSAFLAEETETWVMTRGSTGRPKVLPVTARHLRDIFRCGSRAVLNF
ncbi:MAG: GH3 auxin-responsive promoter family protein, partial [Candidatus Bathyarchaeia archaeon]